MEGTEYDSPASLGRIRPGPAAPTGSRPFATRIRPGQAGPDHPRCRHTVSAAPAAWPRGHAGPGRQTVTVRSRQPCHPGVDRCGVCWQRLHAWAPSGPAARPVGPETGRKPRPATGWLASRRGMNGVAWQCLRALHARLRQARPAPRRNLRPAAEIPSREGRGVINFRGQMLCNNFRGQMLWVVP